MVEINYTFLYWAMALFGGIIGTAFISATHPRGELALHGFVAALCCGLAVVYIQYLRPIMTSLVPSRPLFPDVVIGLMVVGGISLALYQSHAVLSGDTGDVT